MKSGSSSKKGGEKRDDRDRDKQHSTQPSRTTTGHRTLHQKHSRQKDKTMQNSLKQENRPDPRTTGNHRDACSDEKLRFRSRTTTENRVEEHKNADEAEKLESNDAMQRLRN